MNRLKQLLIDDGIEIYAEHTDTLQVAERVRVHLMDSGVVVRGLTTGEAEVSYVVRSEGQSANGLSAQEHLRRVRDACQADAAANGYQETGSSERPIEDPGDASRILDTWYEVRYGKRVPESSMVAEVRHCLAQTKCV